MSKRARDDENDEDDAVSVSSVSVFGLDEPEQDEEFEYCCPKRLRSMEPDVKVIVGGTKTTFLHYSMVLCNVSDYFDVMLSSDMREGTTKVVTFPDKDPDEWLQVYDYIGNPDKELTCASLTTVVPWFSELQMMGWLARADKALQTFLTTLKAKLDKRIIKALKEETPRHRKQHPESSKKLFQDGTLVVNALLSKLDFAIAYNLTSAVEKGLEILAALMNEHFCFFSHSQIINKIVQLLLLQNKDNSPVAAEKDGDDEEQQDPERPEPDRSSSSSPRQVLWDACIKDKIQEQSLVHNGDMDRDSVLENPLLGNVLLLQARLAFAKQKCFAHT